MMIILDNNNNVIGYSNFTENMEIDDTCVIIDDEMIPINFFDEYIQYSFKEGKLIKHSILSEIEKDHIRARRNRECFPIINRGNIWHDMLNAEEKEELGKWYHEWLDATATGVIPDLPSFLDTNGKIIS